MSRTRVYKPDTIAVMNRFFEALQLLIDQKKIRRIQTYCNLYEINKRHLYDQRKDVYKGYFEIAWVIPMVRNFGVPAEWMLLGSGKIFK